MSCCNKYLGLFPHNADIDTGLVADQNGQYKIHLQYLGGIVTKKINLSQSDPIVIERPFNENYNYTLTIEAPNGDLVAQENCTTFSLKTYVDTSEACGDSCEEYT